MNASHHILNLSSQSVVRGRNDRALPLASSYLCGQVHAVATRIQGPRMTKCRAGALSMKSGYAPGILRPMRDVTGTVSGQSALFFATRDVGVFE
jgi:hypothetical protein